MYLSRPEKTAVIIIIIIIAVLAVLSAIATFAISDKGAVEYSENLSYGTLVKLEGTVYETKITNTGGHIIANISGITVFIRNAGSDLILINGDKVKVIGKKEKYLGGDEISVDKISDITILS